MLSFWLSANTKGKQYNRNNSINFSVKLQGEKRLWYLFSKTIILLSHHLA